MQNLLVLRWSNVVYFNCHYAATSVKPSIISRIRYVLNHYWLGSKLLYHNSRLARDIRQKDLNSLTRHDHLILDQFRYDIRIGSSICGFICFTNCWLYSSTSRCEISSININHAKTKGYSRRFFRSGSISISSEKRKNRSSIDYLLI